MKHYLLLLLSLTIISQPNTCGATTVAFDEEDPSGSRRTTRWLECIDKTNYSLTETHKAAAPSSSSSSAGTGAASAESDNDGPPPMPTFFRAETDLAHLVPAIENSEKVEGRKGQRHLIINLDAESESDAGSGDAKLDWNRVLGAFFETGLEGITLRGITGEARREILDRQLEGSESLESAEKGQKVLVVPHAHAVGIIKKAIEEKADD